MDVLQAVALLILVGSSHSVTRRGAASPTVLLEATSTIRSLGSAYEHLLLRLMDDGKVEYDDWAENPPKRRTTSISLRRLSEIERALDAVDANAIHGELGPYHVYEDSSVQLRIRIVSKQKTIAFSVENPWGSAHSRCSGCKEMPKSVRSAVCLIDSLRSEVSGTPVDEPCKARAAPR